MAEHCKEAMDVTEIRKITDGGKTSSNRNFEIRIHHRSIRYESLMSTQPLSSPSTFIDIFQQQAMTAFRKPSFWVLLWLVYSGIVSGWTFPNAKRRHSSNGINKARRQVRRHFSTPFEVDYYDDMNNPYDARMDGSQQLSSLAVPPDTKLVVGLNKYSHDATICAADADTGSVLFAISKERLTRKKHDSGNVAILVEECLRCLNLDIDSITKVVMNNHHHRILPIESNRPHLEWEAGLRINGGEESGYDDDENLLDHAQRVELSHHLAHAYSTACQAPFGHGMVVVMDGMGECYRTMLRAARTNDTSYVSDLSFGKDSFECIPSDLEKRSQESWFDWREAESIYVFEKKQSSNKISLKPIFKRFTQENSPPTLYNHGFENMDSVGALYSRASSHIFGDWNACGKVMGLAPWMEHSWKTEEKVDSVLDNSAPGEDEGGKKVPLIKPKMIGDSVMSGSLHSEEEGKQFCVDRSLLSGIPLISRMDSDMFDDQGNLVRQRRYDFDDGDDDEGVDSDIYDGEEKLLPTRVALDAIAVAHRLQVDLEDIVMDSVKEFQMKTGETNLCIAGGVGLNSVLNGRLSRELGFKNTYVSPYPGDDGIAVGCCAYGLFGNEALDSVNSGEKKSGPTLWSTPLPPYLGPDPSESSIKEAIEGADPWLEVDVVRDENRKLELVAQEIAAGGVVAWYQGRSELGPRALGHRSILADPRKKGLVRFINQHVKKRESFRPFAPSVLAEHATEWFDLGKIEPTSDTDGANNKSPYMSLTAMVHEDKRAQIPAVTHVDGSSRLQTVTPAAEPLYHKLISKFFDLTGVPLVLNTSFNTLPGEPIVESPKDAIRSFLCSMGSIELLVMGDYIIKRKQANLKSLLGEVSKGENAFLTVPGFPIRSGKAFFESSFEFEQGEMEEDMMETKTRVRMPGRPMHQESNGGYFELLDELEGELLAVCDGNTSLNDIMAQYTAIEEDKTITSDDLSNSEELLQNIVHRLVRLYEHTLISW